VLCGNLLYYAATLYRLNQGNKAFKQQNFEDALEFFETVPSLIPSWLTLLPGYSSPLRESLLKKLQLYYLTKNTEEGMDYLEGLSSRYPLLEEDSEFHLWWGNFLFQHSLTQEDAETFIDGLYASLKEYKTALQLNPASWDARYNYELVSQILSAEEEEGQQKLKLLIDEIRRKIRPENKDIPPEMRG
jgi:tetratricopeptide (TPR) repeat protein